MVPLRLVGAVGVALAGLLAIGCDSNHPSGAPASQSSALSSSACADLIRGVDLTKPDTVLAVDRCRFTQAGADAAKAALAGAATGDALWAAIWVYADSGTDPAPLRPFATTGSLTTKAMASAGLVAFGDPGGFAGLREALAAAGVVDGSTPPVSIQDFAAGSLESTVVIDNPPADAAAWRDWLPLHAADLVFDAKTGTWSLP